MAMALLTQSGRELIDKVATDRAFAVAMADFTGRTRECLEYLDTVKTMIGHAEARALVALAHRVDMEEVIAEAHHG